METTLYLRSLEPPAFYFLMTLCLLQMQFSIVCGKVGDLFGMRPCHAFRYSCPVWGFRYTDWGFSVLFPQL